MLKFFRFFPTPNYGKCGGSSRDCSKKKPRDWMDKAFEMHDVHLNENDKIEDPKRRKIADDLTDRILGDKLKKGNPKLLGWWGKCYRLMAMAVFYRKVKNEKQK